MSKPSVKYDEVSDTLTISFESGLPGTGIELTEHILLRINKLERKAISIVFFDIVLTILLNPPVSHFLHLSAYTVSLVETIPIISLQSIPVTSLR